MNNSFDYFVMFAEMRTGSNFLESNLNALDGVVCHGEAFNPHFIAYPNRKDLLGLTQADRDADPQRVIDAIKAQPDNLGGFRFFNDHDPRVFDIVLNDPRCAKIILTRNPLDSYVSWKIAKATNQWKLTNVSKRREAAARFDPEEFAGHVDKLQTFQQRLLNRLQSTGQTAFYIAYEDLQDLSVINGLAKWLGVPAQLGSLDDDLKPQNPKPVAAKVQNAREMENALSSLDRFNLTRTPNFEPRRGAAIPSYVTAAKSPLLFLPVRGGPERSVMQWMADLDDVDVADLSSGMNQKLLRQWKRKHRGHRSFSVLRHPVERAHHAFCTKILSTAAGSYDKIRATLRRQFELPIPEGEPDQSWTVDDHRAAFDAFLSFLRMNLSGQTAIRVDGWWCSQSQSIAGFGEFGPPDMVLRETDLDGMLPVLATLVGKIGSPTPRPEHSDGPFALGDIYDKDLEKRVSEIYQRDYMMFGFGRWSD